MTRRLSFDQVTVTAISDKGMSIGDTLHFHYFNQHGLAKEQGRINKAITALVDAGVVKSGAIMAHGTFDSFHHDRLMAMVGAKTLPSRRDVYVLVKLYTDRNAQARAFVLANGGTVAEVVADDLSEVKARINELSQEG